MSLPPSRSVPLVVAAGLFMENIDSTVIATALPSMAVDLGLPAVRLNLAITTYLVAMAVFIPASGWVADRFGARRVFVSAMGMFLAGSIVCGLAPSLPVLVGGRLMQGLGGAMMTPVGRLVLLRSVPREDLISAMAWLTVPALLGPVIGPPLGGLVITVASWRWIFWINVPIGILGMMLAHRILPQIREEATPPFDGLGFVLSAVGLSALVFAFETVGRDVVAPATTLAAVAVGATLVWAYRRRAAVTPHALIDLDLLSIPTFRAAVFGGSLFRIGVGALPFLLPLQLQLGFGRTPMQSGLTTFVAAVGAIGMKLAAKPIIARFGFRATLAGDAVVAGAFIAVLALVGPGTPLPVLLFLLLAGGFFRSLEFTAINVVAFCDIDPARMSRATSFSAMMQQLSLSCGVALGALSVHLFAGGEGVAPPAWAFASAMAVVGLVSIVSAAAFVRLPADTGRDMIAAAPAAAAGD